MNSDSIRMVNTTEHKLILQVWEESVRASHYFITEADIAVYKNLVRENLPYITIYCLERDRNILGFVGIVGDRIQYLFIRPMYFRKGIGTMLAHFVIKYKGILEVDANEQNDDAVRFYQKLGFRTYKKYPNDGAGKPYPVLSLRLPVSSPKGFRQKISNYLTARIFPRSIICLTYSSFCYSILNHD